MSRDLFEPDPPPPPFKDIRGTRPGVAEEKARLCHQLGFLCLHPPPRVRSGSVDETRHWMTHQRKAMKLLSNPRASVPDLTHAIANLRGFL
jgi:hypothetical protein